MKEIFAFSDPWLTDQACDKIMITLLLMTMMCLRLIDVSLGGGVAIFVNESLFVSILSSVCLFQKNVTLAFRASSCVAIQIVEKLLVLGRYHPSLPTVISYLAHLISSFLRNNITA